MELFHLKILIQRNIINNVTFLYKFEDAGIDKDIEKMQVRTRILTEIEVEKALQKCQIRFYKEDTS